MKRYLILILFCTFSPLWSKSPSASSIAELSETYTLLNLEHLIIVTENNLQNQKILKHLLEEYLKSKKQFLENDQDAANITLLVATADQAWQKIEQQQLMTTFANDFIEELMLFAQLARKQQIATP